VVSVSARAIERVGGRQLLAAVGQGREVTAEGGSLRVFKLKSPYNKIGGFGMFNSSHENMPAGLVWDPFQQNNGVATQEQFLRAMWDYRPTSHGPFRRADAAALPIGCQLLTGSFFFRDEDMFDVPGGWPRSIVTGKYVPESDPIHLEIRQRCLRIAARPASTSIRSERRRYGSPQWVQPRAGQGVSGFPSSTPTIANVRLPESIRCLFSKRRTFSRIPTEENTGHRTGCSFGPISTGYSIGATSPWTSN
jgi:hypothetical protein